MVKCPRCGFEFEPSAEEKPSEVATIALFLASDASGSITGQTLVADCGELA